MKDFLTRAKLVSYPEDTNEPKGACPALAIHREKGVNCFYGTYVAERPCIARCRASFFGARGSARPLFYAEYQQPRGGAIMASATAQSAEIRHRIEHVLIGLRNTQGELTNDSLREFVSYFCNFLEDLKHRMQPPTPSASAFPGKVLAFPPITNQREVRS